MTGSAFNETKAGERFEFGQNWKHYVDSVTEEKIETATKSVQALLGVVSLENKRFIDVGCGSGLFSLVARRLGAEVLSFDYDPNSVAATEGLKERYFPNDAGWQIEQGSVLDKAYLNRLGSFDVVYSWGVLHHTGDMWTAFENVVPLIGPKGKLAIAIYNDQGWKSRAWTQLKKAYCKAPMGFKQAYLVSMISALELKGFVYASAKGEPWKFIERRLFYGRRNTRGMNYFNDMVDWIGGYPFEVGSVEAVTQFFNTQGLEVARVNATPPGGQGCNEFLFQRG